MTTELNYEGFEENLVSVDTRTEPFNKVHYIFRFPNRLGLSVIKGFGSYGYEKDLWEALEIVFEDEDNNYDIWGDEPRGYLTDKEVREYLKEVKEMKR